MLLDTVVVVTAVVDATGVDVSVVALWLVESLSVLLAVDGVGVPTDDVDVVGAALDVSAFVVVDGVLGAAVADGPPLMQDTASLYKALAD